MSAYGKDSVLIELGGWSGFKLGNVFGFAQPALAARMGSFIWLLSWTILPGSCRLLVTMPLPVRAATRTSSDRGDLKTTIGRGR